jgi:hypothetical protein
MAEPVNGEPARCRDAFIRGHDSVGLGFVFYFLGAFVGFLGGLVGSFLSAFFGGAAGFLGGVFGVVAGVFGVLLGGCVFGVVLRLGGGS